MCAAVVKKPRGRPRKDGSAIQVVDVVAGDIPADAGVVAEEIGESNGEIAKEASEPRPSEEKKEERRVEPERREEDKPVERERERRREEETASLERVALTAGSLRMRRCGAIFLCFSFFCAEAMAQRVLPWRSEVERRLDLVEQGNHAPPLNELRRDLDRILQRLQIEGAPRQILPIDGLPKQELPTPGDPKQDLPTPGQPKQKLPTPGQPMQKFTSFTSSHVRIPSHGCSGTIIASRRGESMVLTCWHAFATDRERMRPIVVEVPSLSVSPVKKVGVSLVKVGNASCDLALVRIAYGPLPVIPVGAEDWSGRQAWSCGYDEMGPFVYRPARVLVNGGGLFTVERPWHGRSGGGLVCERSGCLVGVVSGYEGPMIRREVLSGAVGTRGIYVGLDLIRPFVSGC